DRHGIPPGRGHLCARGSPGDRRGQRRGPAGRFFGAQLFFFFKQKTAYEMTAGGPIVKDKLWYFGAGRFTKPERGLNFAVTGGNYATSTDERRYEGKITYALDPRNNAKVGYTKRTTDVRNNRFGTIMDAASLYDNTTDQHVYTANYTSVLSNS